jgi:hypothetical protein
LTGQGEDCVVVNPSSMPKRSGDRIKTDRRDGNTLARLHRAGELTAIYIPTADDVRLLASTQSDLLMDDGSSPAGVVTLRLWQANMVALQSERAINWARRGDAVAWMASAGSPV